MSGHRFSCSGFSGTLKVRNSGLGPDPDFSTKNGPEKVRNWPLGLEFVEMPLVSLNIYYIYIYTLVYSVISGASKNIHDLVANSGPFPDHFWHLGPDPDQVRNSGPLRSH